MGEGVQAGLVGRHAERAIVRERASAVLEGNTSVVWIEGEAGSGKTALVDALVEDLPAAFRVRRAEADERAAGEPLALAAQLGGDVRGGPFAAGMAILETWSMAQDDGPLAVVVEDLHWADPDSRGALLTAVGRLGGDRVLLLLTSRPATSDEWARLRLDPRRCVRLPLAPLTVAEVRELAAGHGITLGATAGARLHTHTGGHPLHLRMLLTELSPGQIIAGDGDLPAPRSLASTTVATIADLPPQARELAVALAVLARPTPPAMVARVAGVPLADALGTLGALDALVATELVRLERDVGGELLTYAHPLHRIAVYDDVPPSGRRGLHRRAAEEVGGREGLAHRIAAAEGPDPVLEADLVALAAEEVRWGRPTVAANALLAASRVTGDRPTADRRLLDAVRLLLADGRSARAAAHRAAVAACSDGPQRDLVLGAVEWESGEPDAAERALRRAVGSAEVEVVAEASVRLATLLHTTDRGDEAVSVARGVLEIADLPAELERQAWIALAAGEHVRAGAVAGVERLALRIAAPESVLPADADLLIARGTLQFFAARPARAVADLEAAIELARRAPRATVELVPRAHLQLSHALLLLGAWDDASVHARLALELIDDERLVWMRAQVHAVLARLAACARGAWSEATSHLDVAGEAAAALGTMDAVLNVLIARAVVADARGDAREILDLFAPLVAGAFDVPMSTSLGWWSMVIDAAVDLGDLPIADDLLARLVTAADARSIDLEVAVERCRARIADARGDAVDALAAALRSTRALGPDTSVLERGRLEHHHGLLLLRAGRRRDGLERLRSACATLAGAGPLRGRVEADLVAAGGAGPAPGVRLPSLTEREHAVVTLVRRGLTNRETAAALYVSDKAVEYHLGNVYAKLGIRSRRELRDLAPD